MSNDHSVNEAALAAAHSFGEALWLAIAWLRSVGVDTPELDAQILLTHSVGLQRSTIIAYPERTLTAKQAHAYAELVARRAAHEPVAYLIGHREFMGLNFLTDARGLIPRPETELLVEAALTEIGARLTQASLPVLADIGTGSGAIALSIAVLEPRLPFIYATDISVDALALAQVNATRLGVAEHIIWLQGDLLDPLPQPLDILLANLPYIAPQEATILPDDVRRYEPQLALYGADDGLGHLRRLFQQAPAHLKPQATLLLEFGYDQRTAIEALAQATFPGCTLSSSGDYAGWDRYITIHTA